MRFVLALMITFLLAGAVQAQVAPSDTSGVVAGNNQLGLDLLVKLSAEKPDQPVVIAPYGITTLLAAANGGLAPIDQPKLQQYFHASNQAALDQAMQQLVAQIKADDPNQFSSANAFWVDEKAELDPTYKSNVEKFYDGAVEKVNFSQPEDAKKTISEWVQEKTHDMIQSIQSVLTPRTVLLATNAIYFKGKWETPFEKADTKPDFFQTLQGNKQKVDFMNATREFQYGEMGGAQIVELPFKRPADQPYPFSLIVVLPPKTIAGAMPPEEWLKQNGITWMNPSYLERRGTLKLPKFSVAYSADNLLPALKQCCGIDISGRMFAAIKTPNNDPAVIDQMIQQVKMDVDEEGAEAAALTELMVKTTSAFGYQPPPPFEMIVDRPFIYALRHDPTKTVLFMGTMNSLPENK